MVDELMRDQAVVGEGGEQGTAERPAGQQGKRGGREGEQQPLAEHQATRLACRGTVARSSAIWRRRNCTDSASVLATMKIATPVISPLTRQTTGRGWCSGWPRR